MRISLLLIPNGMASFKKQGLARVVLNAKVGFIDNAGKKIIPLNYDYADSFNKGLARIALDSLWGFVDKSGNEVIPLIYEEAHGFINGVAKVKQYDRWISINKIGECVDNCLTEKEEEMILREIYFKNYDYVGKFNDGLAKVQLNDMYGFIDKSGAEVRSEEHTSELQSRFDLVCRL